MLCLGASIGFFQVCLHLHLCAAHPLALRCVLHISMQVLMHCVCPARPPPQGDPRKLVDDIGALRPTLFAGVPRVFERIHAGVLDSVG